jgi:hypothetical protein
MKKAQEEMTGFILIVVMLIVMGVAFLFMFRPTVQAKTDIKLNNLMTSILESTENGIKISETIDDCASFGGSYCPAARSALEIRLKAGLSELGYEAGKNIQGYSLNVTKTTGESLFEPIKAGAASISYIATPPNPIKDIDVILRVYY